jgi:phosphoribosylformylglycinamidine cyclo-ligase
MAIIETMKKADKYGESGVDLASADRAKSRLSELVRSTMMNENAGDFGNFGAAYSLKNLGAGNYLVSSVDGIGTKLKIAIMASKHDTVGHDLVNHLSNDILCLGAKPLFFMDYIGLGKMNEETVVSLVRGVVDGCRENGCALLGGETAEMPGLYDEADYDLAGFMVGVARKSQMPNKADIRPGDRLVGFSSSGLHTNGYSLARRAFLEIGGMSLDDKVPETGNKLGDDLLSIHRSYISTLYPLIRKKLIKALAHITGGGFEGNISRIIPSNVDAAVDTTFWFPPGIFKAIQRLAGVELEEMYRVFNMGVGMIAVVAEKDIPALRKALKAPNCEVVPAGVITEGTGKVKLKF